MNVFEIGQLGGVAKMGNRDRTFEWLERAYAERRSLLCFLNVLPTYDDLPADPRFKDLVRRIGLTP